MRGIGRAIREASRDVVEAEVPARLRKLLAQLACLERHRGSGNGNLCNGNTGR